jgi:nucleoside-diphosphate-sugar epimerase
MHVVVTGSTGKIGKEAVAALQRAGHTVQRWDLKADHATQTAAVDCTDFGQVLGALAGMDPTPAVPDAIVHLAGIPAPGLAPDHTTFAEDTLATYNILAAAGKLGIKRVVWASSETLFGLPFTTPPDAVPLLETAPLRPEWSYSLSKKMCESMADEFVRWHEGLVIISLRFSNVVTKAEYPQVLAMQHDPALRKANLWSYVDARDAGEACRLAVEAPLSGHQVLTIAAADTMMNVPTAQLLRTYFPTVPVTQALSEYQSLLGVGQAHKLIGYRPTHSWREHAGQ